MKLLRVALAAGRSRAWSVAIGRSGLGVTARKSNHNWGATARKANHNAMQVMLGV